MFILIYLLGLSLLYLISKDFKITERLALAMPMGLGLTTFIMFFLDRVTNTITVPAILLSVVMCMVIMVGIRLYFDWKANDLPWKRPMPKIDFSWFNLIWAVFAGMTAYLVYGIVLKCMYWPPAEFDTIEGYDLLAKGIGHEHTLVNSIITNKEIVAGCATRLLYPPLIALANSICYMTGMETPRLINALFFISWAFIVYQLLRRFVTSANASLFTLLIVIIPEMFAHGSFSLTNMPCAVYSTIAVVSIVIWYEQKKEGFFYLSCVAMMFSIWTRSEVIVFIGVIMAMLFFVAITQKRYKYLFIYAVTVWPFLVWNMFLKAYVPRKQSEFFIKHLFYDSAKMNRILSTAGEMMFKRSDIYGLTFNIFVAGLFIGIIINIAVNFNRSKWILAGLVGWVIVALAFSFNAFSLLLLGVFLVAAFLVSRDKWMLLAIFLLALSGYTAIYYQVNDADGSLFAAGGWMQSGYKRGLFCYAPLALFYVSTSKWVKWAFDKLESQLILFRP